MSLDHPLREYSIAELKLEDEDLGMEMTMGLVISGTYLDLLKFKRSLENIEELHVVYKIISNNHLAVVKKEDWRKYEEWRKNQKT